MNTKTLLIVGGVAVGAFLVYKYVTSKQAAAHRQPSTTPTNIGTQGNQQGAPGTSGNGIIDTASGIIRGGESIWNQIGNLFGGDNSGSTPATSNG